MLQWQGVDSGFVEVPDPVSAPSSDSSSTRKTIQAPVSHVDGVLGFDISPTAAGWGGVDQPDTSRAPGRDGWSVDLLSSLGFDSSTAAPNVAYSGADYAYDLSSSKALDSLLTSKNLVLGERSNFNGEWQWQQQAFDKTTLAPVGSSYSISQDQDPGNLFFGAILGMLTFGVATAAGFGVGAATAAVDAAPVSSGAYDAFSSYLATGASDGSVASGFGGYAGAISGAPEVLSAAVPGWGVTTIAIDAAPSSLASTASSAVPSSSSAASTVASAAAPAASSGSIFGTGGALGALGQVAGLVSSGLGIAGQLGVLPGSPSSSSPSPQTVAARQAQAAERRTLLLIAGAVALVLVLRK